VIAGFIDYAPPPVRDGRCAGFVADASCSTTARPHGAINYFQYILARSLGCTGRGRVHQRAVRVASQLDAGVTTCHDISQIHFTQQHSEAAIKGSADSGRRIVFGFFEGARADLLGSPPGAWYPEGASISGTSSFPPATAMTMFMGGEIYLLGNNTDTGSRTYHRAWALGRQLGIPIAAHIVGSFGMGPEFDKIAQATLDNTSNTTKFGSDNLFIPHDRHVRQGLDTQSSQSGAGVSLAVPIEMNMRHGTPPILKTLSMAIPPSLQRRCGGHADRGHVHPDALCHEPAAHVHERPRARRDLCRPASRNLELLTKPRRAALRHHRGGEGPSSSDGKTARLHRARRPTSSSSDRRKRSTCTRQRPVPAAVVSLMEPQQRRGP